MTRCPPPLRLCGARSQSRRGDRLAFRRRLDASLISRRISINVTRSRAPWRSDMRDRVRRAAFGLVFAGATLSRGLVVSPADAQSCDPAYATVCVPLGIDPCESTSGYLIAACCNPSLVVLPDDTSSGSWPHED